MSWARTKGATGKKWVSWITRTWRDLGLGWGVLPPSFSVRLWPSPPAVCAQHSVRVCPLTLSCTAQRQSLSSHLVLHSTASESVLSPCPAQHSVRVCPLTFSSLSTVTSWDALPLSHEVITEFTCITAVTDGSQRIPLGQTVQLDRQVSESLWDSTARQTSQ